MVHRDGMLIEVQGIACSLPGELIRRTCEELFKKFLGQEHESEVCLAACSSYLGGRYQVVGVVRTIDRIMVAEIKVTD